MRLSTCMVFWSSRGAGLNAARVVQRRRKNTLYIVPVFSRTLGAMSLAAETPGGLCTGKDSTLRCLKENFRELYRTDYPRFGKILRNAEKKARKCDSVAETVSFLEVARLIKGGAEVGEYFSEVIEKLCMKKPRCFLDALARVDEESRAVIVRELRTPTFLEEAAIRNVFLRYRDNPKYKAIMEQYFAP